ncbi:MAG TPA: flagellar basal body-associated FliL family protein [Chthonomonadaceae bacterium]|nr:flagellar basal body-associated FliL family protein [Chthonomonadaceae bacterium]
MAGKAATAQGAKPKQNLMPIIMGVVALIAVLAMAKTMMAAKSEAKEKKASEEVGISMPLEEFLVNLNGGDHYLRATVALGMKKGITEEQAKEHIAPIRDAILTVLSGKTLRELSNPKGREDLKEELKEKINKETGEDSVVKVYFTAFATQ